MNTTTRRIGASALAATALVHLALVPQHAAEAPFLGGLFLLSFLACSTLAVRLMRIDSVAARAAGVACAWGMAGLYLVSRTRGLGAMREGWDAVGLAALAFDLVAVLALGGALGRITRHRIGTVGAVVVALAGAIAPVQAGLAWGGGGTPCANSGCTTAFATALPIPKVLAPTSTDATTDYYTLTESATSASIIPNKTTPVWTYNGSFPGPTIKAASGRQVRIHLVNNLPEDTTMHVHGAHVDALSDGGPDHPVAPGASRDYTFPNQQSARTQWYHDHAMDVTGAHVNKGLAGMYLISDSQEQSFNLPSDAYDVPLVLQDRKFNADGTMAYSADASRGGFLGDVQLVNGAAQPYFKVAARKYRFRILNGSNARYYKLGLSNGATITEIGNESGLFSAPISSTSVSLAPAERADLVIDFSKLAVGTSVTLKNSQYDSVGDPIRFDVTSTASDASTVPSTLRPFAKIAASQSTVTRTFDIDQRNGVWTFNGLPYNMARIDATPKLDAVETWIFNNHSGDDHPIHIHDINFQLVEGSWGALTPDQAQWKETVNVPSWGSVKVIAQFTDFRSGPYMFHCHILEHEDKALMGQFSVV